MTVIVVATGLAGFGASAALLGLGMSSIPVRYAVAMLVAYAVFLLLVRLWAEYQRRRLQRDSRVLTTWSPPLSKGGKTRSGAAQGGAGTALRARPTSDSRAHQSASEAGVAGESVLQAVDLDELLLPLAVLAGGLAAAVYVVSAAPLLLAEVLLDVVLVSGLYHRLRTLEPQSWLATAVRRTWRPVAAATVLVAVVGFVVQTMVPQIHSIGDVLKTLR